MNEFKVFRPHSLTLISLPLTEENYWTKHFLALFALLTEVGYRETGGSRLQACREERREDRSTQVLRT